MVKRIEILQSFDVEWNIVARLQICKELCNFLVLVPPYSS